MNKKFLVALATLVVAGIAAYGALAWFSQAGMGNGAAKVGNVATIILAGTQTDSQVLYPGVDGNTETITVTNPGGGPQYVGTVSGTFLDYVGPYATCPGAWFQMTPLVINAVIPAGATQTYTTPVKMLDTGGNQNACINQTMTIKLASS